MSSNSVCNHTRDKQNRTPAARSSDFVITRMITDRIGLHSVLLPLLITISGEGKSIDIQCGVCQSFTLFLKFESSFNKPKSWWLFKHQKFKVVHTTLLGLNCNCKFRIGSCLACVYRVMDARGKFGEHSRSVRVARGAAESNSSFLSALQTSQVHP